jgi:hypothetical protein
VWPCVKWLVISGNLSLCASGLALNRPALQLVACPKSGGYVFSLLWTYGYLEIDLQHIKHLPAFRDDKTSKEVIRKFNSLPGVLLDEGRHRLRPNLALAVFGDERARQELLTILGWIAQRLLSELME